MPRAAAITYEQVAAAAAQLQAEGLTPTGNLLRAKLGNVGSMGTYQNYLKRWRAKPEDDESVTRMLPPEIQRVIFKYLDGEVSRINGELRQQLEQARRDVDDLAADNDEQNNSVVQLQAELAEQAMLKAKQDGQLARLLEELSSAREETSVERRERELAQLELSRIQLRLEAHASLESELRQLRADFEAQRQACVHAEQNAAVLQAQKDILEARVAELKEAASVDIEGGDTDENAGKNSSRSPKASPRRRTKTRNAGEPSMQDPGIESSPAAHAAREPEDQKQAKLC